MARPSFSLSDDEARQLVAEMIGLEQRHPLNPRDHRLFVREFIGVIYLITGKAYSPAIYRRLLSAYAPDRKPSTATLAIEKERFVKQLDRRAAAADPQAGNQVEGNAELDDIRQMLEDLMARPTLRGAGPPDSYLQAQCDFLQQRLSQSEKQIADAKAATSALDTQRQVLEAQLREARSQVETLQSSGTTMQDQLAMLTRAIDEARQFALLAIDESRGETRAWRERCNASEAQLKAQVSITETFRRLAYRQGADIPPSLQAKPT
ncbi:hypothetical protein I4X03_022670 [Massilia sp. R798]|uniref:KfrA N-terminal DNA-binding domain-containing protein n=2 Tax=Massilia soli TaxID=2792854 RepID=A0ABS7SVX1_9BURK|nr:hypothetical protein [Massilia soli]